MNVARILYPVEVLGPGKRVGIWVCGCHRGCKGCSNPELWIPKPEYELSIGQVIELIEKIAISHKIDGFTISGGEPMNQAASLAELLGYLTKYSTDVLIYTGYRIEELETCGDENVEKVMNRAAVLVDGEYIEDENTNVLLRGSANQRIYILNPQYSERYTAYLETMHNQIQNFSTSNGVISVGIHKKGFRG